MDGFNGFINILMVEEVMMIKDRLIDGKKIISRFLGVLEKLNSKGKDSKKIRQTLLHWCYELNY